MSDDGRHRKCGTARPKKFQGKQWLIAVSAAQCRTSYRRCSELVQANKARVYARATPERALYGKCGTVRHCGTAAPPPAGV